MGQSLWSLAVALQRFLPTNTTHLLLASGNGLRLALGIHLDKLWVKLSVSSVLHPPNSSPHLESDNENDGKEAQHVGEGSEKHVRDGRPVAEC